MGAPKKGYVIFLSALMAGSSLAQNYDHSKEMSPEELLIELRKNRTGLTAIENAFDTKVLGKVKSTIVRNLLAKQFRRAFETTDPSAINRVPKLPLHTVNLLRALLEMQSDSSVPRTHERIEVDLAGLLARPVTIDPPKVFVPEVPQLLRGSRADSTYTEDFQKNSVRVADLLTALSVKNDSALLNFNNTARISTVAEFLSALIATGHTVKVSSVRTNANFIGFIYEGKDVRWPGWLETDVQASNGEKVVVPMGHSQLLYDISGPQVNALVTFYLGTSGVGFFAHTSIEPRWAGSRTLYTLSSKDAGEQAAILKTADLSSAYIQKLVAEITPDTPNVAGDGYGFLGVCNDSVASVEYFTRKEVTSYPLIRGNDLDERLNGITLNLPNDSQPVTDPADVLKRILWMSPFDINSNDFFDADLKRTMQAVAASAKH